MAQLVESSFCKRVDLSSSSRNHVKHGAWWLTPEVLALGRSRQVAPWGSLTSQPGLMGKPQALVRDPVSKKEQYPVLNSDLCTDTNTHSNNNYSHNLKNCSDISSKLELLRNS